MSSTIALKCKLDLKRSVDSKRSLSTSPFRSVSIGSEAELRIPKTSFKLSTENEAANLLLSMSNIVSEEIKPQRRWQSLPEITRKQAETKALQERLLPGEQCILLDEQGQQLDSIGLSHWLENFHLQSVPQITFMVGGPYGLDRESFPQQTKQLSLSPMTFSHQMVRLILLEQV